jgi:hypothetical protein
VVVVVDGRGLVVVVGRGAGGLVVVVDFEGPSSLIVVVVADGAVPPVELGRPWQAAVPESVNVFPA